MLSSVNANAGPNMIDTRFAWSGPDLLLERSGSSGAILRRYVHGPGFDNPIVWYEGSGTSNPRFLMADERGSVVSVTDSAGATIAINSYDEYGIPAPTNVGRFGYTGQIWLPELKLWYYKARMYSPTLGRFLQTDPIGYGDGMNWYNYVGGDPVNGVDPSGTIGVGVCNPGHSGGDAGCGGSWGDIVVNGTRSNGASIGGGFDIGPQLPSLNLDFWQQRETQAAPAAAGNTKSASCNLSTGAVHLDATLFVGTLMAGKAHLRGTVTHLDTGRVVSFSTTTPFAAGSEGGSLGVALGTYSITGTFSGMTNFTSSTGLSAGFATIGYKYFGVGASRLANQNGTLGIVDIGGTLAAPTGFALMEFPKPNFKIDKKGICK